MRPEEHDLLQYYFPAAAVEQVGALYEQRRFTLKFNRPRNSKLGDFRPPRSKTSICHITLNCDLNPYQMLITYIHEVAHYDVYQHYGTRSVQPHGKEWQEQFTVLLLPFMKDSIFPKDVLEALQNHLKHIKASSSADLILHRVLQRYDRKKSSNTTTVESLPEGARFALKNGLVFEKGEKQRTRFKCRCENNGRWYFVSAIAEVVAMT